MTSGLGLLTLLAGQCPRMRAEADQVAAQLQRGPATALELRAAVPCPRRLGLALAFLRDLGTIEVQSEPRGAALVYQLAAGLLPPPAAVLPLRLVLRQLPELPALQQLRLDEPRRGHA